MKALAVVAVVIAAATLAGTSAAASAWYRWNASVSWQWVAHPACGYYDRCWQIDVKARRGCPNGVYVSMNLTQNGRVIDYTNDSLDSLRPNEVGRLTLGVSRSGALLGRVTKIQCY